MVLSLLAIAVSVWFALRQERLSKKQHELDRKMAAIEEERRAEEVASRRAADVTAEFESEPRRGSAIAERHYLTLINRGAAPATDVDIDLPVGEGVPTVWKDGMGFPISLDPQQRFRIPAAGGSYGENPTLRLTISWTDESGSHEKKLNLPAP